MASNGGGGQVPSGVVSGGGRNYHHNHHGHHVHHVVHAQNSTRGFYSEPYELSQDLIAKQLEVLEKKYGGSTKAKDAALTIQRAFRRYSMAKKFAHLTAQMKTEKRISRQIEVTCTVATTTTNPSTLNPSSATSASTTASSSSSPRISSLQRSSSSGSSHQSPQRQNSSNFHSNSCRHYSKVDRTAGDASSSSPGTSGSHPHAHSRHLYHQHTSSSQETDLGNDSTGSSNSNQHDVQGGLQSFPLDESSVYHHQHHVHHPRGGHQHQTVLQHSPNCANNPQILQNTDVVPTHKRSDPGLASPSQSRNHKRMASAPHVPKRTVSRLTSLEHNNNNNKSPSRRSASTSNSSGAYFLPDVDMRLTKLQYHRTVVPSSTSPLPVMSPAEMMSNMYTVNEVIRKRHYRTGLNIFNKKPDKGIAYLIQRGFLENSPAAVARFLITRKGLSKQMIGEYLGSIQSQFNMQVLNCFAQEMDFGGMHIDIALRKFQTYFRMPGEAQKIERLMQIFSTRYCQCNREFLATLHSSDTVFILAFAIILLNTDLHTPNIKPEKRMKLEDFIRNLRAIDEGHDLDPEMLAGIYERIRGQEFRPGSDHVTQVIKVQQTIVAKCPNLSVPHRRLVCYCRLYEVQDRHKKERPGLHQREIFLFNDILVITKIHSRKKNSVTYTFRQSYLLVGMVVTLFETPFYPFGIQMAQKWDRKIVLVLNARNEHDRSKFVEDLKESIAEMDEMETLRLETELEKQRLSMADNRDSAIQDDSNTSTSDLVLRTSNSGLSNANGVVMRKSAINNSLLDLTDSSEKMARRGSVGSLDSGMSISFQSNSMFTSNNHNNSHQCSQNRNQRNNGSGPPQLQLQQQNSSKQH